MLQNRVHFKAWLCIHDNLNKCILVIYRLRVPLSILRNLLPLIYSQSPLFSTKSLFDIYEYMIYI